MPDHDATATRPVLRYAVSPTDYEALGRERYADMSVDQRKSHLSDILAISGSAALLLEAEKSFARGWLSEHSRNTPTRTCATCRFFQKPSEPGALGECGAEQSGFWLVTSGDSCGTWEAA